MADPAGEGEVEQLGQLGPDLSGLPVDGVAAEEDEVERARRRAARRPGRRAVASVSEPTNAGSQTCRPASAPQATPSRRTSSAPGARA